MDQQNCPRHAPTQTLTPTINCMAFGRRAKGDREQVHVDHRSTLAQQPSSLASITVVASQLVSLLPPLTSLHLHLPQSSQRDAFKL